MPPETLKKLFDDLLTVRITFQKAWHAGARVPSAKRKASTVSSPVARSPILRGHLISRTPVPPPPQMQSDESEADVAEDLTTSTLAPHRTACLDAFGALSEDLFTLREQVARRLPGYTAGEEGSATKRRRVAGQTGEAAYWRASADDSLTMVDS